MFRLKSDKLKTVNQDFDELIQIDSGTIHENYYVVKDHNYSKYKINIIRYIENDSSNKTFTYIHIYVNDKNIIDLIEIDRRRWKIENQGFNIQKNILFNIEHICCHDFNAMRTHYIFIQFVHIIRQLFDYTTGI